MNSPKEAQKTSRSQQLRRTPSLQLRFMEWIEKDNSIDWWDPADDREFSVEDDEKDEDYQLNGQLEFKSPKRKRIPRENRQINTKKRNSNGSLYYF